MWEQALQGVDGGKVRRGHRVRPGTDGDLYRFIPPPLVLPVKGRGSRRGRVVWGDQQSNVEPVLWSPG